MAAFKHTANLMDEHTGMNRMLIHKHAPPSPYMFLLRVFSLNSGTVFVLCENDRTRSPSIVAAYIIMKCNFDVESAQTKLDATMQARRELLGAEFTYDIHQRNLMLLTCIHLGVFQYNQVKSLFNCLTHHRVAQSSTERSRLSAK